MLLKQERYEGEDLFLSMANIFGHSFLNKRRARGNRICVIEQLNV